MRPWEAYMYHAGIDTFLAVIRSQSLSRAAEELNLAQTTISQRLKVLEREMGIVLIERKKGVKQIRLTPAGEEFVKLAEQWSFIWREAKILRTQGPSLSLAVGAVDSINSFVLPQAFLAIYNDKNPIKLKIHTSHSDELYSEIEKRKVDVAFVLRELIHPNVVVKECFSVPMVVLRRERPAADASDILNPADFAAENELFMPWGRGYQNWHEHWWDPLNSSQVKLDNAHLLLNLLKDEHQWAIVPKFIADNALLRGGYMSNFLSDPPPAYTCYKLVHKSPTSLTKKSLEIFEKHLKNATSSFASL